MKTSILQLVALVAAVWPMSTAAAAKDWSAAEWRQRLEADWLVEAHCRADDRPVTNLTTRDDAAGAVDGVKNGRWGFHTAQAKDPWWQVDLGAPQAIARVVIWNRCEAAERAARLRLLLSGDGQEWRTVYQHDGTPFFGFTDKKPLEISLTNQTAQFVRVQLPGNTFLHLEEVEVFGVDDPAKNLALRRPADQVSTSEWSADHSPAREPDWRREAAGAMATCGRLLREEHGGSLRHESEPELAGLKSQLASLPASASAQPLYLKARALQRRLALDNPLLDFDAILFTERVPPSFNHMSDQYYGWWSKPGGGIYLLRDFKSAPRVECLTDSFTHAGTFLRPTLSYDGRRVLFAWCRHYPNLAEEKNKLDKANVPEDAFFHLFEMNLDGSGLRQITHGKYDDFDGRYLPDGRIVFLSTRRGQSLQVGRASAALTEARADQADCYVRCGGDESRPVAVYTLHTMNADGSGICAISPFEMFEWTPEIAHDGSILYSRWDYIDRDNMPYMGLWATTPDGLNPRIVYGNYTKAPHCTFEPKPVPNSRKIIFTASGHHSQTMGSLVLLDPSVALEGAAPVTRLTPEVPFPEIEGWPKTYYANPWPLSERHHLVAWGHEGATVPGPSGWDRWHAVQRPHNGMALYFFDAKIGRELLFADREIACGDPIPVRARPLPPVIAPTVDWSGPAEGRFLLTDVYRGLRTVRRGDIKALRLVAVPPKTHPVMNAPNLGITHDDPGKCVLGTVPVEADGSAYFRMPAGVIVFFQALDARGLAVQTMRSATHVQPGQTLSCGGCHDDRQQAPPPRRTQASLREPSRISEGPPGTWPLRFDQLVQPVLDRHCVRCHSSGGSDAKAVAFNLTPAKSWEALVSFGKPSLQEVVWAGYRRGYSVENEGPARTSALLALLEAPRGHHDVRLSSDDRERLITWMDTYAQRAGAFDAAQEKQLEEQRRASADLLIPRGDKSAAVDGPRLGKLD